MKIKCGEKRLNEWEKLRKCEGSFGEMETDLEQKASRKGQVLSEYHPRGVVCLGAQGLAKGAEPGRNSACAP